jgi:predicted amidohydrolase YtcJ
LDWPCDDPFESAVDALKDIRVDTTVVGGRVVHE